jgi:uncharacterized protein (TIGR02453 family)
MKATVNMKSVLAFLSNLEKNNNKQWFDANRARYEQARSEFEHFVQLLIAEISKFDNMGGLAAKDCIFRINRDLRFSKDKTPYKTNMGASIAPGGKKSPQQSYYVHVMPHNQSFLAGGLHMPTPDQLKRFRQAIDRDAAPFKRIINAKNFVETFGKLDGNKLAMMPKGYPVDHPTAVLLKLKEVVVGHRLSDKDLSSADIVAESARVFKTLKPFLKYLDSI